MMAAAVNADALVDGAMCIRYGQHCIVVMECCVQLELEGGTSGKLKEILMLSIPTFFDLVATVLMNIGLLNVTASVYQMMRGAEMLFAALFTSVFLHRVLNKNHYLGILCCGVSCLSFP